MQRGTTFAERMTNLGEAIALRLEGMRMMESAYVSPDLPYITDPDLYAKGQATYDAGVELGELNRSKG